MQDRTRSRLTLFARLWPVSVILLFILCITIGYAVIENKHSLIGLSFLGICFILIVQVCQLVAAIVVRRWWCFAGTVIGIILSTLILLFTTVGLAAGQYRPPKMIDNDYVDSTEVVEDLTFPIEYKGEKPTITEFVTAISLRENTFDEYFCFQEDWEKHTKGEALDKGHSFDIDTKNSYFRYEQQDKQEDGPLYGAVLEYHSWDFTDGSGTIIAENCVDYRDGEPFEGQYSGLTFFLYDKETDRMQQISPDGLNAELELPEGTQIAVHKLPRKGDTIECECYTESGKVTKRLVWNGSSFDAK